MHRSMLKRHRNVLETSLVKLIFSWFFDFVVVFFRLRKPTPPHRPVPKWHPYPTLNACQTIENIYFLSRFSPGPRSSYMLPETRAFGPEPRPCAKYKSMVFIFPRISVLPGDFVPPPWIQWYAWNWYGWVQIFTRVWSKNAFHVVWVVPYAI